MSIGAHDSIRSVEWTKQGLRLLDQRALPGRCQYLQCSDVAGVAQAISEMVVRGAPAIAISAAYAVAIAARARYTIAPITWKQDVEADLVLLAASRPTAVNLSWALNRMRQKIVAADGDPTEVLLAEARTMHEQDVVANHLMGKIGASLLAIGDRVLTHCNTGSLATGGYGTALGVIRAGYGAGKISHVFAGETRPWLQGARLTAWELLRDSIPVTLIADSAAAYLMQQGELQWVIVGADRIAANGDVANKIGTYHLAVMARHHGVRFMVVAPTSTIDSSLAQGADIPIEVRSPQEVLSLGGQVIAATGAQAWNPAFDITPADLIDALVTEKGCVLNPTHGRLAALMAP